MTVTLQKGNVNVVLKQGAYNFKLYAGNNNFEIVQSADEVTIQQPNPQLLVQSERNGGHSMVVQPEATEEFHAELETVENVIELYGPRAESIIEQEITQPDLNRVESPINLTLSPALYRSTSVIEDAEAPAICTALESVEDVVYISGNPVSGVIQVRTVDPTLRSKMPGIGIIISKSSDTDCRIKLFGVIENFYTGLTANGPLYVGIDGRLTHTPPTPTVGSSVYKQIFGEAFGADMIMVSPQLLMIREDG
jgi:hypothetical protein